MRVQVLVSQQYLDAIDAMRYDGQTRSDVVFHMIMQPIEKALRSSAQNQK